MSKLKTIDFEVNEGVAILTLNRPKQLNAMNYSMRLDFEKCLDLIEEDNSIRVVILQANGDSFCSGADLLDVPKTPEDWRGRVMMAQAHHLRLLKLEMPVIVAVQGKVAGGGISLALCADFLIMSDTSKLIFSFVKIGLVPDGGVGYLLQAKLNPSLARELLMSGGELTAIDAQKFGLTSRVVGVENLRAEAWELSKKLKKIPSHSIAFTKKLCNRSILAEIDDYLNEEIDLFVQASSTPEHKKLLQDFQKK